MNECKFSTFEHSLIVTGFEKSRLPRTIINNKNTKFNYSFHSISGRHGATRMKFFTNL